MRRQGFTLIELLVVVAIIALLIAILMPALSKAKARANQLACLTKQRQIFTASFMWSADHNQWLMPATFYKKLERYGMAWGDDIFRCSATDASDYQADPNSHKSIGINQNLCMPTYGPAGPYTGLVVWSWGPNFVFYNTHANARTIDVKHPAEFVYFCDTAEGSNGYVAGYWWNVYGGRRHDDMANILWIDGHGSFEPDDFVDVLIPTAAGGGQPYFLDKD
ncbi:prepilin-type N-terminal cleavage/methylation domain-containing protein [Planctomycetales bacterium ZRK34]|nr:prepilin-type N-terminal cleavage/methylation domain-containing protein [Planctomycetales bacterium ZRK34]